MAISKNTYLDGHVSEIEYKYNRKTHNIKILNSHKVIKKNEMIDHLNNMPLHLIDRSVESCVNEWAAHNRLYWAGIFEENCCDCDLTKNESKFRRAGYWLLSRFYK